jgi:predicted aminopeptidase
MSPPKRLRRLLRWASALGAVALLPACASIGYYSQSISGHLSLMNKARPVKAVLEDSSTPERVRNRLRLSQEVRDFAVSELGLPDNDSYRTYADVGKPNVVWNVTATDEFSLAPQKWCFLVVGCISYRGYFAREDADVYAATLAAEGQDVQVSGARAYSTLGYFGDPLLNTMLDQSEADLIDVIIHELGHQQVYVKDDSGFNEAFATAVAKEGVRRWFSVKGDADAYTAYLKGQTRSNDFYAMLNRTRARLRELYQRDLPVTEKREGKRTVFAQLKAEYEMVRDEKWDGYRGYERWFGRDLNNAHLSLVATYRELVPAFTALIQKHNGDMPAFYAETRQIGALPRDERRAALDAAATTLLTDATTTLRLVD